MLNWLSAPPEKRFRKSITPPPTLLKRFAMAAVSTPGVGI